MLIFVEHLLFHGDEGEGGIALWSGVALAFGVAVGVFKVGPVGVATMTSTSSSGSELLDLSNLGLGFGSGWGSGSELGSGSGSDSDSDSSSELDDHSLVVVPR